MHTEDRLRRLHDKVIIELTRKLRSDYPEAQIQPNARFRKQHYKVPDMPIGYYPDVVDFTNKVAYEVHVHRKQPEEKWSELPGGWRGVNVFTVDIWQKDEVYIWSPDSEYVRINKDHWQSVKRSIQRVLQANPDLIEEGLTWFSPSGP